MKRDRKIQKLSYDKWLTAMNGSLLEPDMPLLSPVGEDNLEALLRGFHHMGINPRRAAELFNLRWLVAVKAGEEEEGEKV